MAILRIEKTKKKLELVTEHGEVCRANSVIIKMVSGRPAKIEVVRGNKRNVLYFDRFYANLNGGE
jgi:hypothetical protein